MEKAKAGIKEAHTTGFNEYGWIEFKKRFDEMVNMKTDNCCSVPFAFVKKWKD